MNQTTKVFRENNVFLSDNFCVRSMYWTGIWSCYCEHGLYCLRWLQVNA